MYQFYTLSNGLRIGAEVIPDVKSVTAGFFVRAGGMTETKEEQGISHFIEHMLFKGTKRRSACSLVQEIDRTGGVLNAFTSDEYTCVYAKVLDRQLETAMDVLCDMIFHSQLRPEDIELEKKVIGEEIHLYEDAPDAFDAIFRHVIALGKCIEVNTSGYATTGDTFAHSSLIRRYIELGGENFTFGSDSHDTARDYADVERAKEMVRALGGKYQVSFEGRKAKYWKI